MQREAKDWPSRGNKHLVVSSSHKILQVLSRAVLVVDTVQVSGPVAMVSTIRVCCSCVSHGS